MALNTPILKSFYSKEAAVRQKNWKCCRELNGRHNYYNSESFHCVLKATISTYRITCHRKDNWYIFHFNGTVVIHLYVPRIANEVWQCEAIWFCSTYAGAANSYGRIGQFVELMQTIQIHTRIGNSKSMLQLISKIWALSMTRTLKITLVPSSKPMRGSYIKLCRSTDNTMS